MNAKDLIKFFRNKKKTERAMTWLNKALFEQYVIITKPIIDDNNLFTKKEHMVKAHEFIATPDVTILTNEILTQVIRETISLRNRE